MEVIIYLPHYHNMCVSTPIGDSQTRTVFDPHAYIELYVVSTPFGDSLLTFAVLVVF